MKYVRLEQGTVQWLAWQREGIGASDAAAILGVSPWRTPRQLWEVLTGRRVPAPSTFAMRRGLRLEPVARRLYEEQTGHLMEPCCGVHDRHGWLRASLDGLDLAGELVLEIKAPHLDAHGEALAGKVPDHYWPQVQHELAVTGAALLHYVSYSEHRALDRRERLALVEVRPDPGYIVRLVHAEWCFWGCVLLDYWPSQEEENQPCTRSLCG